MIDTMQNSNQTSNQTMTSWALARASVDSLAQAIESGNNDALFNYLQIMARFPRFSARNILLIAAACPNATHLEGVRSWNELGRFVRPGEKGISIFAPVRGTNNQQSQAQAQFLGVRKVWVWDITQTGGEELPESQQPVDVADKLDRLTAFAQAQGMTLEYADWLGTKKASSYRGRIRLLPDMNAAEEFPVLLREVASQLLYAIRRRTTVTRILHQQEIKAAAFVVCEALGLENKTEFSDCQLYFGDSRMLAESLQVVHRTAAAILGAISPEMAVRPQSAQEEVQ